MWGDRKGLLSISYVETASVLSVVVKKTGSVGANKPVIVQDKGRLSCVAQQLLNSGMQFPLPLATVNLITHHAPWVTEFFKLVM